MRSGDHSFPQGSSPEMNLTRLEFELSYFETAG